MGLTDKGKFFIKNFLRGLIILTIFVVLFILFNKYIKIEEEDYLRFLSPIVDNPPLVFTIYTLSEILFGIIPPEVFFIWSTEYAQNLDTYLFDISLLAIISYAAGLLGFWIGVKLNETIIYRWIKRRYLMKYQKHLNNYGFFVIIVAALTPLPFSGISMLMGSVNYPFRKFWIYALSRFIRYGIYSIIFWEIKLI
jgi:membrane protein YqaA with SNARE-associated domain